MIGGKFKSWSLESCRKFDNGVLNDFPSGEADPFADNGDFGDDADADGDDDELHFCASTLPPLNSRSIALGVVGLAFDKFPSKSFVIKISEFPACCSSM